jgi:ribosomal-protein-alanine N-acetyltransferase
MGGAAMQLPQLATERLLLLHAEPGQAQAHADFMRRNRAHFAPWDPPRPPDFESPEGWAGRLQDAVVAYAQDREVRFVMFERKTEAMIGRINFTSISRGPFQSCLLGYQIDAAFEGRGLMREALRAAVGYMFEARRLHRIEANYRPENARSAALLARLGFERIGLAPEYLFIDGAWRDHVQTHRLNDRFDPAWLHAAAADGPDAGAAAGSDSVTGA